MVCEHKWQTRVEIYDIDTESEFSLFGMLSHVQNIISEHTKIMEVDFPNVSVKSNAFWVISKSTLKVCKSAKWGDKLNVKTYPLTPGIVRCERETIVTDEQGDIVAIEVTEWCMLDLTTSFPRRVSSTCYPKDLEYNTAQAGFKAEKLCCNDEMEYKYDYAIMLSDLDFNGHTNNRIYTKLALNVFTAKDMKIYKIASYSVNFENQSYEGDTIKVYYLKVGEKHYVRGINAENGKRIFTSSITLEKR